MMLLAFPVMAQAQCKLMDEVHDKYSGLEDTFTLNISGSFLSMADWLDNDWESDERDDMAQSINSIRILKVPVGGQGMSAAEVAGIKRNIMREKFDEFMSIKGDEGGNFLIMAKEHKGVISDLVLYGKDDNDIIFIEFLGTMDAKKVAKMCNEIETSKI